MFAICLGRIEFRELAEISGWCGAKKSLQWVLAIQSVTRFTTRDAWDDAAFIDQSGCCGESEIHYAPSDKIVSESALVGGRMEKT
jgi:hypothetical protein